MKIDHRKIQLPKIGLLKTYEDLPTGLTPKTAIISRTAQRWFVSLTCSCCGHIQEMPLKERVFNCSGCSISIDRDLNAALNLEHQAFILA
ncbi:MULTISPECIES: zinc ribbon domain-containing protein [unclassified Microcoleus]|uniref:zinc ribbon domain-containing protein n=1 Tax=unclassified Microcoleus TaxID=2642155 RepID=UPI002FD67621